MGGFLFLFCFVLFFVLFFFWGGGGGGAYNQNFMVLHVSICMKRANKTTLYHDSKYTVQHNNY